MSEMKEIRRRIMCTEDEGMGCGPVSMTAIEAEIVVDDNGQNIYLRGLWLTEPADELFFEATLESVYDVYEKEYKGEIDFDSFIVERDRIEETRIANDSKYQPFYDILKEMLLNEIHERGYDEYYWGDKEDDEDEEYDDSIQEISRRAMTNEEEGMACGPVDIFASIGEIVLNDNGKTIYLYGCWVQEVPEEFEFYATTESIYDLYEKNFNGEIDVNLLVQERDRILETRIEDVSAYEHFYEELKEMVYDEAGYDGELIEWDDEFDEDEDDE